MSVSGIVKSQRLTWARYLSRSKCMGGGGYIGLEMTGKHLGSLPVLTEGEERGKR